MELAAVQSFFSGLILSNMTVKNRRDFEYHFVEVSDKKREMIIKEK
jgi:hypothetical protein